MRIKIRDWDSFFEADRSRQWKKLSWVPVPNKQGLGYKKIMANKNGASIFGCWNALVQQASLCSPRGDLSKYSIDDLSTNTMIPILVLTEAIDFITQSLDWIEVIENIDRNVNECHQTGQQPVVASSLLCSSILSVLSNTSNTLMESKILFDEFRKKYPGSKRGNKTEYEYFCKRHCDHSVILPLLLPAVDNQSAWRLEISGNGQFVPEWLPLEKWLECGWWNLDEKSFFKKINSTPKPFLCPDHLFDIWPDYIATRKKKKAVETDNALRLIVRELEKLAPGNFEKQHAILEKSIKSGWTDVYQLKDDSWKQGQFNGQSHDDHPDAWSVPMPDYGERPRD